MLRPHHLRTTWLRIIFIHSSTALSTRSASVLYTFNFHIYMYLYLLFRISPWYIPVSNVIFFRSSQDYQRLTEI